VGNTGLQYPRTHTNTTYIVGPTSVATFTLRHTPTHYLFHIFCLRIMPYNYPTSNYTYYRLFYTIALNP